MEIIRLIQGVFQTNTYILKEGNDIIIIDPAGKVSKIEEHLNNKPLSVLLTHGHFDHIKCVDDLYKKYQMDIYMMEEDLKLTDPKESKINNCFMGLTASISSPIRYLSEGIMNIGSFRFEVIKTPGHTKGSCIYVFDDEIFTGDTLFKNSAGRTDLYGGSESELKQSLKIFKTFNKDYHIYPGHEDDTLLSYELLNNYYLR